MASQVYYRKWRPRRFHELVSQEHVSTTLRQAVQRRRVAHSYLFCGPRGTGKTSTARVLAKAVNCLKPQDGDACDECDLCQAVNEGRCLDLIEMDAASNRGIDEIRNIRDRVNLAPVGGGYKVYIIDEAHMLTEHASNAFLKTLEEPPNHAIFILCTTEPHKILGTVISRCQRFDFRRLPSDAIMERLRGICREEAVHVDGEALAAIARSAGGSLRDAENLLEQLVVSYGDQIGISEANSLLGLDHGEESTDFTRYLLMGNTSAALACINRAAWDGVDLRQLHRQAVELLRGVLMIQCGARASLDLPKETIQALEDLAPKTSMTRAMRSLKLLGEVNMKHDATSPLALELAVVEVCLEDASEDASRLNEPPSQRSSTPDVTAGEMPTPTPLYSSSAIPPSKARVAEGGEVQAARPTGATTIRSAPESELSPIVGAPASQSPTPPSEEGRSVEGDVPPAARVPEPEETEGSLHDQWAALVRTLSRYKGKRFNIGALLRDCKSQHIAGETLVLSFAHRSHLERMQEELDDPQGMKTVNEALLRSLGSSYQLSLTLEGDNGSVSSSSPNDSPLVRAALNMGARIMEEREQ